MHPTQTLVILKLLNMDYQRVTVRIPATTANLGPGFDCLGLALELWNVVRLEIGKPKVVINGEGANTLSLGDENLILQAARALFQQARLPTPNLRLHCRNAIPLSRGLGSSAAAVVGGLVAANTLCGEPLTKEEILALAVSLDGHPDNVAPALLGGFQIVVKEEDRFRPTTVSLPEWLSAVVFIPEMEMPTHEARRILSSQISREDVVYNLGRVGLLVNALNTGTAQDLRLATQDALHQPPRQALFPAMEPIINGALEAGALGVFLSGAGSSIVAFTRHHQRRVGSAMAKVASEWNVKGTARILRPSLQGCYIVSNQ